MAKELEEKGLSMALNAWKWLWDSKSVKGNSRKMSLAGSAEFLQCDALLKGMSELETILDCWRMRAMWNWISRWLGA